jgi:hypothetical protein
MSIDTRRLVAEHAAGWSYRDIAAAHDISHEWARRLVTDGALEFVTSIEMGLFLAQADQRQGREAVWPHFVIETGTQEELSLSSALFVYVTAALRDSGLDVEITPVLSESGRRVAFRLTLEEEEER